MYFLVKNNIFSIKISKTCVVLKVKKILKQHQVTWVVSIVLKQKNVKSTSTEEQPVDCVCHARGFIQTYFLFNLLINLFSKNSIFKAY